MLLPRTRKPMARYQDGQLIERPRAWYARWYEDVVGPDGKIHRERRYRNIGDKRTLPNKRAAQRRLAAILSEVNSEGYRPRQGGTFGEFAGKWKTAVLPLRKKSSQSSDRSILKVHLIPEFGRMGFTEITAEVLQFYVSKHTASAKTVTNIVKLMESMWTTARSWGYTSTNPFEGLKLPAFVKGNAYCFSAEEMLLILKEASGWHHTFLRILAQTGIRPGELCGLRREDVKGRVLHVRQSAWRTQVQTPKTPNAVRRFPIGQGLAQELDEWIRKAPKNDLGLVFASKQGQPLDMDNFRKRVLRPILEKTGILAKIEAAKVRGGNYAFRHGAATNMDGLAVPIKTRQAMLGHARAETTLEHYTHPIDSAALAASDALEAMVSPADGEAIQ